MACLTRLSPSCPWKAESISNLGCSSTSSDSPKKADSNSSTLEVAGLVGERIFLKSSWMARLSSITRICRINVLLLMLSERVSWFPWEIERERGAFTGTVTMHEESTAHFFCGRGSTVQAESVTILFSCKTPHKNIVQILRRNTDAIVADGDPD